MTYTKVGIPEPRRVWGGGRRFRSRKKWQRGGGAMFKGSIDHAMNRLEKMAPQLIDHAISSIIDIPTQKLVAKINSLRGGRRKYYRKKRRNVKNIYGKGLFSVLFKGLTKTAAKQMAKQAAKTTARELAKGAVSSLGTAAVNKVVN